MVELSFYSRLGNMKVVPNPPELADSGQDCDGSVPDVAGVVHLPILHLHLCILEPQCDASVVHIQRTLVDGACP